MNGRRLAALYARLALGSAFLSAVAARFGLWDRDGHAPDAIYEEARAHFGEKELSDLTLAVATINAWNRLSIAARLVPGAYQPATHR